MALALLLSTGVRAEDLVVEEVQAGTLQLVDGRSLEVQGGAYLPPATLLATSRELAGLRAENKALKEAPVASPPILLIAFGAGLVLGAGAVAFALR